MTLFPSSNIPASFLGSYQLSTYIHTWGESGNKSSNILVCLPLFHLLNTFASIFSLCDYILVDQILIFLRYFFSERVLTSHDVHAKLTKVFVKHFHVGFALTSNYSN